MDSLKDALDKAMGRRATGDPTRAVTYEVVEVVCDHCRVITKFPVYPGERRKPGPCLKCGERI